MIRSSVLCTSNVKYFLSAILLGVVIAASNVEAAPVAGEVFEVKQPNGERVQVRIWGDEFYQVVESLDGYTLTRDNATGRICYAKLSADQRQNVKALWTRAGAIGQQQDRVRRATRLGLRDTANLLRRNADEAAR